jgi:hypothetical protein
MIQPAALGRGRGGFLPALPPLALLLYPEPHLPTTPDHATPPALPTPKHEPPTEYSVYDYLFCPKSKDPKDQKRKSKPTCPDPPTSPFLRYHTADSLSATHHVRSNGRTTMTSPSPSPSHLGDFSKIDIRLTQP